MTTIADIAKELGVSKGTVSKALNNAEDISPAMRHAVIEKAVEMGYTRCPRGRKMPRLAVFVCNMEYRNPTDFGYDLVLGFRKAAEPYGYQVEVIPLDVPTQERTGYDAYMMQYNFAGALFLGLSLSDPWLRDFAACATPAALYDNHCSANPRVTQVGIDNLDGMKLGVSYLKSLGHERIGYLGSALGSYVCRQRYEAYWRALEDCGLPADRELVGTEPNVMDCLYHHLPRLLDRGCTAIVCSHDLLASSALTYCRELGKSVPRDVSILGFDDIPLCEYTQPPLTTLRQDRSLIGKSAFSALCNQLAGIPLGSILLHPKLVCRGSCAAAPTESE